MLATRREANGVRAVSTCPCMKPMCRTWLPTNIIAAVAAPATSSVPEGMRLWSAFFMPGKVGHRTANTCPVLCQPGRRDAVPETSTQPVDAARQERRGALLARIPTRDDAVALEQESQVAV